MSSRFYHFAYASNMLRESLLCYNRRAVKVFKVTAKLPGYRLAFCRDWPMPGTWHGPTATLRKQTSSHVWGVIWELDTAIKRELDSRKSSHEVMELDLDGTDGNVYPCYLFTLSENKGLEEKPSPQYLDVIIRGAKRANLPPEYIQFLQSIQHNGFQGRLPLYEDIITLLNSPY